MLLARFTLLEFENARSSAWLLSVTGDITFEAALFALLYATTASLLAFIYSFVCLLNSYAQLTLSDSRLQYKNSKKAITPLVTTIK